MCQVAGTDFSLDMDGRECGFVYVSKLEEAFDQVRCPAPSDKPLVRLLIVDACRGEGEGGGEGTGGFLWFIERAEIGKSSRGRIGTMLGRFVNIV